MIVLRSERQPQALPDLDRFSCARPRRLENDSIAARWQKEKMTSLEVVQCLKAHPLSLISRDTPPHCLGGD